MSTSSPPPPTHVHIPPGGEASSTWIGLTAPPQMVSGTPGRVYDMIKRRGHGPVNHDVTTYI